MNAGDHRKHKCCINKNCPDPENPGDGDHCEWCQTPLMILERYIPNQRLPRNGARRKQIFEVFDLQERTTKILKVTFQPTEAEASKILMEYGILTSIDRQGQIPRADYESMFTISTQSGEIHGFVMEKIEGISLNDWIEQGNRATDQQVLDWLPQLVELCSLVHGIHHVHRDIKPSNIILTREGKIALIDFEGALELTRKYLTQRQLNASTDYSHLLTDNYRAGTMGYSAPEQQDGYPTPLSDFFGIARSFVHLTTGVSPKSLTFDTEGLIVWQELAPQISPLLGRLIDEMQCLDYRERLTDPRSVFRRVAGIRRNRWKYSKPIRTAISFLLVSTLGLAAWKVIEWRNTQTKATADTLIAEGANEQIKGSYKAAREKYEESLRLRPNSIEAVSNLGRLCQETKDYNCAIQTYNFGIQQAKSIQDHSSLGLLYFNIADLLDTQQHFQEALNYYELADTFSDPSIKPDIQNNIARLHNLEGRYEKAKKIAQKALSLMPSNSRLTQEQIFTKSRLQRNIGWSLLELGEAATAIQTLREAIRANPSSADSYCLLARSLEVSRGFSLESRHAWTSCFFSPSGNSPETQKWRKQHWENLWESF